MGLVLLRRLTMGSYIVTTGNQKVVTETMTAIALKSVNPQDFPLLLWV